VTIILAAASESFRERVHERLLEAGCETIRVAASLSALESGVRECVNPTVVTGGDWPSSRPFVRVAVRESVPAIVLSGVAPASVARAALAAGARGALDAEISATALAAALAAVQAGLTAIDHLLLSAAPILRTAGAPEATAHRYARPLTSREQQILALVASGTSNKGVARALGVSTNTVKFHLAAAFEKLDVTTRAEAVAQAIRRGELSV